METGKLLDGDGRKSPSAIYIRCSTLHSEYIVEMINWVRGPPECGGGDMCAAKGGVGFRRTKRAASAWLPSRSGSIGSILGKATFTTDHCM